MHVDHPDLERAGRWPAPTMDAQGRAERVLAEYLRQWGLRDPSTIAVHCRRWVQRVTELLPDYQETANSKNDIARLALAEAMSDMDKWLDHLALLVSADSAEASSRRGLLATKLKTVLDNFPAALLEYESLPPTLLQALQGAARPVVPTACQRTRMQGPRLGVLPPLLRVQRWRRVVEWMTTPIFFLFGYERSK